MVNLSTKNYIINTILQVEEKCTNYSTIYHLKRRLGSLPAFTSLGIMQLWIIEIQVLTGKQVYSSALFSYRLLSLNEREVARLNCHRIDEVA